MKDRLPRRSKNITNIVAMLRLFFRPTTVKEGRGVPTNKIWNFVINDAEKLYFNMKCTEHGEETGFFLCQHRILFLNNDKTQKRHVSTFVRHLVRKK